jgi:hypothetical protein
MILKRHFMLMVLKTLALTVVVFSVLPLRSGSSGTKPPYDPWLDTDDNGAINMGDVVSVLDAFGATGTPLEKASKLYDSGWLDLTGQTGENYTIVHNLNLSGADIIVDARKRDLLGWNMTYGGTGSDFANSMVQTVNGGYALAGWTNSFGAGWWDFWLVKTDANGKMLWNKTYGGTYDDDAYSVVQTGDGGYALAGWTWSFGAGGLDTWLVKTDAGGNMLWNKTYGGTGYDEAYSVVQTVDGGYALAGETSSLGAGNFDFWLVKTDANGNMLWNKTYGGTGYDWAWSMVQTVDGGYALAGYTNSSGAGRGDFWLVKTDASGNMLWNKTYGGGTGGEAHSVIQTDDGGYALVGGTTYFGTGNGDFWLVKTDASGNMLWNKTYGGTSDDKAYSVVQTDDGGYALTGYGTNIHDFWLVKTDASGDMLWNKTCGGPGDEAYSVVQTGDGGYALAGMTNSFGAGSWDFWLVKTDANGNMLSNTESGLAWVDSSPNSITLYRGTTDWSYVHVQIWKHR